MPGPRMCSAEFTSTSYRNLPAPKARRAASSTPRAASSGSWSRCSNRTQGRVYDPCCGSSGMFVQSVQFIRRPRHGQRQRSPRTRSGGSKARGDISIYGQESTHTTWRLARMNLAIRGIAGPDRPRRQLRQRPPSRPQGRLHPRQSAVQRLRLGRRTARRRQTVAIRHPPQGKRQLRLGTAHGPSFGAKRHRRLRARQWFHVVGPIR